MARALASAGQSLLRPCRGPRRAGRDRDRRAIRSRALVGAKAKNVIFTSGGTEASNMVLSPSFRRLGGDGVRGRCSCSAPPSIPACLSGHRFPAEAVELAPGRRRWAHRSGLARGAAASRPEPDRVLVSVQLANNETGVIQPVAEIARPRSRAWRASACGRGAGGRQDPDRYRGARGRCADALGPQDRRARRASARSSSASDQLEIADRLIRGGGQERG